MGKKYTTTTSSKQPNQWQMLLEKIKPALHKPKVIIGLTVVLVLVLSLGLTLIQTQKSQEVRSDASGGTLPTPDVKLIVSDPTRSHDENPSAAGLQLSAGKTGMIDIKVDPKGLPAVGVELFASYNPEKIEIPNKGANSRIFEQFAQISKVGTNQVRLLVLLKPGQAPITNMVNVGNIQIKLKQPLTNSILTLTKANFIVDNQSSLRQISGLANDSAIAQAHAVYIQPFTTPTVAATNTPPPANTPTPTVDAGAVPNVTLSGNIVDAKVVKLTNGDIKTTYYLSQSTPSGWQVNVVAVPSNQSSIPASADRRIRSTECKNVAARTECQIIIPAADLSGKTKIFLFANQFKSYGTTGNIYYCNWENNGTWKVQDARHNPLTGSDPTTTCSNHTLDSILISNIMALPTPTTKAVATPTPIITRTPM